jgi:hypothetical protein
VVPDEGRPALVVPATRAWRFRNVFSNRAWREPNLQLEPKFISDPLFAPGQIVGCHSTIKRRTSAEITGRPIGLDLQRQNRRNAARCQPIRVAGLTITKALRQLKKRASLDRTNRSAALVGTAFFSRSLNSARCLRRNRFSAARAVRARKPATQKLAQSEKRICNVTLSFRSCRRMLSTSQSSHGCSTDLITRSQFCGPQEISTFRSALPTPSR